MSEKLNPILKLDQYLLETHYEEAKKLIDSIISSVYSYLSASAASKLDACIAGKIQEIIHVINVIDNITNSHI